MFIFYIYFRISVEAGASNFCPDTPCWNWNDETDTCELQKGKQLQDLKLTYKLIK